MAGSWFPGHMALAKRNLSAWLAKCDLYIEVRDARAPLISSNQLLSQRTNGLIVCNKKQLADPIINQRWQNYFSKQNQPCLFCNFLVKSDIRAIRSWLRQWQKKHPKKLRLPLRVMIVGLPNTGKSTLVNRLRMKNISAVKPIPAATKHPQWIVLDNDLELLDSPGILLPVQKTKHQDAIIALIYASRDDPLLVADNCEFLLRLLIAKPTPEFIARYKLPQLKSSISTFELLDQIRLNLQPAIKDHQSATYNLELRLINDFRAGRLGRISLEQPASLR